MITSMIDFVIVYVTKKSNWTWKLQLSPHNNFQDCNLKMIFKKLLLLFLKLKWIKNSSHDNYWPMDILVNMSYLMQQVSCDHYNSWEGERCPIQLCSQLSQSQKISCHKKKWIPILLVVNQVFNQPTTKFNLWQIMLAHNCKHIHFKHIYTYIYIFLFYIYSMRCVNKI
jgi:hypothetical protein